MKSNIINMASLDDMIRKFFISSFQCNAHVNKQVLKTMEQYSKYMGVPDENLMFYKLPGKTILEDDVPKIMNTYRIIEGNIRINNKLSLSNFAVKPQQIKPFTGLDSFTKGEGSFIFGATKQYLQTVATKNGKLPKLMLTTGTVTDPNYNLKHRVGRLAYKDHTYGGIYIETDKNYFYMRHIPFYKNGKAYDLAKEFNGRTVKDIQPSAMVIGDWHTGETDKKIRKKTFEMINKYKPKNIFIHDFADFKSINHHEDGKIIDKVMSYKTTNLNLEQEIKMIAKELKYFVNNIPKKTKIYIVKSNHDEWLHQYLNYGKFLQQPQNAYLSSKLLTMAFDGLDVFEEAVKMFYNFPKDKVTFLKSDDSVKIQGYELAEHGHKGANGARGSIRTYEKATQMQISAHTHTPLIQRKQIIVGTSTILEPSYVKGGLSSWMNAHAFVYKPGMAQLITFIKGNYEV